MNHQKTGSHNQNGAGIDSPVQCPQQLQLRCPFLGFYHKYTQQRKDHAESGNQHRSQDRIEL